MYSLPQKHTVLYWAPGSKKHSSRSRKHWNSRNCISGWWYSPNRRAWTSSGTQAPVYWTVWTQCGGGTCRSFGTQTWCGWSWGRWRSVFVLTSPAIVCVWFVVFVIFLLHIVLLLWTHFSLSCCFGCLLWLLWLSFSRRDLTVCPFGVECHILGWFMWSSVSQQDVVSSFRLNHSVMVVVFRHLYLRCGASTTEIRNQGDQSHTHFSLSIEELPPNRFGGCYFRYAAAKQWRLFASRALQCS